MDIDHVVRVSAPQYPLRHAMREDKRFEALWFRGAGQDVFKKPAIHLMAAIFKLSCVIERNSRCSRLRLPMHSDCYQNSQVGDQALNRSEMSHRTDTCAKNFTGVQIAFSIMASMRSRWEIPPAKNHLRNARYEASAERAAPSCGNVYTRRSPKAGAEHCNMPWAVRRALPTE